MDTRWNEKGAALRGWRKVCTKEVLKRKNPLRRGNCRKQGKALPGMKGEKGGEKS